MSRTRYDITATVYDRRGRVLSIGKNRYDRTHPRQAELAEAVGLPYKMFMHAEVVAIIRSLKKGIPYRIRIERYKKDGSPAMACPCPICQLAIKEAGIEEVSYTVG